MWLWAETTRTRLKISRITLNDLLLLDEWLNLQIKFFFFTWVMIAPTTNIPIA